MRKSETSKSGTTLKLPRRCAECPSAARAALQHASTHVPAAHIALEHCVLQGVVGDHLEAAKGQEKALGPDHPHTQTTWEALRRHEQDFAQHQEEQGRKQEEEEGEETIGQRLAKRRRASG